MHHRVLEAAPPARGGRVTGSNAALQIPSGYMVTPLPLDGRRQTNESYFTFCPCWRAYSCSRCKAEPHDASPTHHPLSTQSSESSIPGYVALHPFLVVAFFSCVLVPIVSEIPTVSSRSQGYYLLPPLPLARTRNIP